MVLLLATSTFAGGIAGTFRLGPTGIYCIKAPCPWRGITKLDAGGKPDGKPLWTDSALPAIEAEVDIRARVAKAWKASLCLVVEGKLEGDRFAVSRIVGDC
jgi:hypothetical protein